MYRKGLIWTAIVVYLGVVLGCVLQPNHSSANDDSDNAPPPHLAKLEGLPFRGVAMQIQRVDWIEQYKKSIDEIVELGADTWLCVVDARQENGSSSKIYLDMRMTPTPDKLGDLIDYAKSKKLRVILMPIVLLDAPRGNEWRGTIKPTLWEDWFDSYRDMMNHFAWIAQSHKADVMVVGSELVSAESHAEEWHKVIYQVRERFKGYLTYSSNWDHYQNIPFWDQLDVIGMNSYWSLGNDRNVTVEEITDNWKKIQKDLFKFSAQKNKPILLLEAGWCSLANAADEPWDYTKTSEPIDLDLQKRLWQGFFHAWHGSPYMAGFMVWAWAPNDGGLEDKGYTPKGKPAYDVIHKWLKTPWSEKPGEN